MKKTTYKILYNNRIADSFSNVMCIFIEEIHDVT